MNYYKCELGHEETPGMINMCHTCILAHENQRKKLTEFVKSLTKRSCCIACECVSCDALKVLKEIGEI